MTKAYDEVEQPAIKFELYTTITGKDIRPANLQGGDKEDKTHRQNSRV